MSEAAPALELCDVSFDRRGVPILENVDLILKRGDYMAVLGPNGGGKTTLIKVILGAITPSTGTVRVFGGPPSSARGRVGYVPQHARFDLEFPIRVLDVVLMGRLHAKRWFRRFSADDRRIAREQLERMEIADLAHRPIGALSGGQLQRVLIARALALEPELLLLDEPTSSLDGKMEHGLWELLDTISEKLSLVVVSHDIGAISRHVSRVGCLNRKLHVHASRQLTPDIIEAAYGCPVDLVAHGHPHRVLHAHPEDGGETT